MKFIITVDTEGDNQWQVHEHVQTRNIDFIPRFQELCEKYNFCPTYLTSYEIINDPKFRRIIGKYIKQRTAEIGAHLHPWTCPPYVPSIDGKGNFIPYPHELPLDLFEEKMVILTKRLEETFDGPVWSYRAGRWGFCSKHIAILKKMKYTVDCSVTPLISWKHVKGDPNGEGGKDFISAPCHAYMLNQENVNEKGHSGIYEVPPSIVFLKGKILKEIILNRPQNKIIRGLKYFGFGPHWLRPLPYISTSRLIEVCNDWIKGGASYVQFMIHSSELMPGGSPYYRNKHEIEELYRKIEQFFRYLKQQEDMHGILLCDYVETLKEDKTKGNNINGG